MRFASLDSRCKHRVWKELRQTRRYLIYLKLFALAIGALQNALGYAAPVIYPDTLPRHALVIGNRAYSTVPLDNPVNDARAMAETLESVGFRVTKVEDAPQKALYDAIRSFGDALKDGGIGLFYYAGHGLQVKGHNYLLPVDAIIQREDEVAYQAFDAQQILDKMQSAGNALNIVILDACRNNPFARGSRNAAVGLAPMDAPVGTIIAFATAPGAEASDGVGKHGLYTEQLLYYIKQPGLKVEDVFKRVRVALRQATSGRQIPWENTSLEGDFYFASPTPATLEVAAVDVSALELELWHEIEGSNNVLDYQAYLERFPNGRFAALARNRVVTAMQKERPNVALQPAQATASLRGSSSFSFSAEEEKINTRQPTQFPPAVPCARELRNARVRLDINEKPLREASGGAQGSSGPLASALSVHLRKVGIRTGNASQVDYLLRGAITSQASPNRYLALSEVSVTAALTLTRSTGDVVSTILSREESYAGNNLAAVYLTLVQEQANRVANQLYLDLCTPN